MNLYSCYVTNEGELMGQPTNPGSPGHWPLSTGV